MDDSEARLEEIRERAKAADKEMTDGQPHIQNLATLYHYGLDVPYLLSHIEALKAENEQLRREFSEVGS